MKSDVKATPVVYIVDDDDAIRKSLGFLMKAQGYQAISCGSAAEFLERYDASQRGCMVLDVRMPGMSGLELQELMRETGIRIPVIIITGHGDVPMAVRAMKAGAKDFIEKPFQNEALLRRIDSVLDGGQGARGAFPDAAARLARLTPRERETMELLVEGRLNKQVAATLGISVRTVESHRARIMEKLGVRSLSELVRLSLELRPD